MRIALSVLSGILLGLSFPNFGISLASFVALLPLLIALHVPGRPSSEAVSPRLAFRLGYLTGATFFLILLYWIPRLPHENLTVPIAIYPALLLMVGYLALYPGLTALTAAWLVRRGIPVGLSFPWIWTLLEAVRGTGVIGFPWGSLGYAMAPMPHLIQFVEYTGVWGATLWLALLNGVIHIYLQSRWLAPKLVSLGAMIFLVLTPYLHGRQVLDHRKPRVGTRVGIVQPNVGNEKWKLAVRDSVIDALLEQTADLAEAHAAQPPSLILWPETSIPVLLPRSPLHRSRVESLVDSLGIPVLAGFPDGSRLPDGSTRFTNSAALFLPHRGIVAQYDKQHLVPFSENFPVPFLNRYDFGQSDFSSGNKPGILRDMEVPFGVLICFESIFPSLARQLSLEGARYLVNITNDQWFGDSAAPAQHFYMNVFRTIENRVGLARCANTGISGVIDPYGFVRERTPTFISTQMVSAVELGRDPTFYARFGEWVLLVAGGVLAALTGVALWKGRKR